MTIFFLFIAVRMYFLYTNIGYPEYIIVNDMRYLKGTELYVSTLNETKLMFLLFGIGSLVTSLTMSFFTYKRIKRKTNLTIR